MNSPKLLEFKTREFESFYKDQILRGQRTFQKQQVIGITKSTVLCLGGTALILLSSIQFNLVPIGVTLILFGCYYAYIWAKLEQSFKKIKSATIRELHKFLQQFDAAEVISVEIDNDSIQYFKNGQRISAIDWRYFAKLNNERYRSFKGFHRMEQLILIPKFAFRKVFYQSVLSLARNRFRIV